MATPLLLALILMQGPAAPSTSVVWTDDLLGLALGGAPELAQPHRVFVQPGAWLGGVPAGEVAPRGFVQRGPLTVWGTGREMVLSPFPVSYGEVGLRAMPAPWIRNPGYGCYLGPDARGGQGPFPDGSYECEVVRSGYEQIQAKVEHGREVTEQKERQAQWNPPAAGTQSSTSGSGFSGGMYVGQPGSSGGGARSGGGASAHKEGRDL